MIRKVWFLQQQQNVMRLCTMTVIYQTSNYAFENCYSKTFIRKLLFENFYSKTFIKKLLFENLYSKTFIRKLVFENFYSKTFIRKVLFHMLGFLYSN